MSKPATNSVSQRDHDNRGLIRFAGGLDDTRLTAVEVRAIPTDGTTADATPWQSATVNGVRFDGQIQLPAGGWYDIEARGRNGDELVGSFSVTRVGIGEVFVIAGQSNSANFGQYRQAPADERVVTMDARGAWRPATDPLPVANGSGGSPWPAFGDLLVDRFDVPVDHGGL